MDPCPGLSRHFPISAFGVSVDSDVIYDSTPDSRDNHHPVFSQSLDSASIPVCLEFPPPLYDSDCLDHSASLYSLVEELNSFVSSLYSIVPRDSSPSSPSSSSSSSLNAPLSRDTCSTSPVSLASPPSPHLSLSSDSAFPTIPSSSAFSFSLSDSISPVSLENVTNVLTSSSPQPANHRDFYSFFMQLHDTIPPPTNPYTTLQLASLWLSEQFSQSPFVTAIRPDSAFLYKKVTNKTRPVMTTLPEMFRIIRHEHPDPLADLVPLPTRPPNFVPTDRFTAEHCDKMELGKDFLLPEEIKLAEWIVRTHEAAFAWTDEERGSFDPKYFAPIEIPHISHIPWVLHQGPIPRRILQEVIKIIEDKWRSGVYEPSSSSYNSRWFSVFKKDGKSLRLVHSLEPLNAVTVRNAAMPPYTDIIAEDFSGRSIYTTLDLYVSFDQQQLHENSCDMTTFNTPLGSFRLTVLPMGWTNSPAVLQGDVTHILCPKIPHWTQPFANDIPIKGPVSRYELPDGTCETIPDNPGIRRFI